MMQNPFQSFQSFQSDPTLAYTGVAAPFNLPYTAMQASINPALNPLAATQGLASCATAGIPQLGQQNYTGVPNFVGLHPQQLQLASILAAQAAAPQLSGLPNLYANFQNPYQVAALQNPWLTAGLQNPLLYPTLNPILAQQFVPALGSPFGLHQSYTPYQQISPFAQQGLPYGQQGVPYAPQISPFAQQGLPYGQQGVPYVQQISPFSQHGLPYGQIGSSLAPQTWVGQASPFGGQSLGQIHPVIAPFGARQLHTHGISPWAGF